jgi:hypothetical protein
MRSENAYEIDTTKKSIKEVAEEVENWLLAVIS